MENDVINLKSLSADAPLLQYNNWANLKTTPQVRPSSKSQVVGKQAPPREHKKQLAFHQSLAKSRVVFGCNRTGKIVC